MTEPMSWYYITDHLYNLRRDILKQLEDRQPVNGVDVLIELERARVEALLVVVGPERAK